MTNKMLKLILI